MSSLGLIADGELGDCEDELTPPMGLKKEKLDGAASGLDSGYSASLASNRQPKMMSWRG
jgi:hypothetical protein